MRKTVILCILICMAYMLFPAPEAKAMDPVTMALLAPVALSLAEKAKPYVIKGLKNGLKGLLYMGKDMIDIFRLPIGFLQATVGIPFGGLKPGLKNIVLGGIAPFKLAFHTVLMPAMFCGLKIN